MASQRGQIHNWSVQTVDLSDSVSQLDKEGHHISFVNNSWKVAKGSKVVARGKKTGTLYLVSYEEELNIVEEGVGELSLSMVDSMTLLFSRHSLKKMALLSKDKFQESPTDLLSDSDWLVYILL